jgi:hypothetical protein
MTGTDYTLFTHKSVPVIFERTIFWEVIVAVTLSTKLYKNVCPIPNGFRDRAI